MENGLLLLYSTPQPFSLFLQLNTSTTSLHFRFSSHQLRLTYSLARYSKWGSNAENLPPRNFNFNFNPEEDDDDSDEDDEPDKDENRRSSSFESQMRSKKSRNLFEEVVESIWILKVFKSYGWLLPTIIISFLLATGPKAFISTMALSLGLSALSLAVMKLYEKTQNRPKRKKKARRKPYSRDSTSFEVDEERQDEAQDIGDKEMGEFWVGSDYGSVRKGSKDDLSFGGWGDLNGAGYVPRKPRSKNGSGMNRKVRLSGSGRKRKDKLSESRRNSEMPLLLKLLIAIFPFVSSLAEFW